MPNGRRCAETYAYLLDETFQMILALPEPASTIVATAAFAGLRKDEIRGLLWENFREDAMPFGSRSLFGRGS